ncbi:MAG: FtsX-like permease family protein [candidate division WOR-3 bacterium]
MSWFVIKGILRDRSRSLFPLVVVTVGVALAVFLDAYLRGAQDSIFAATARLATGHLRVVTRAQAELGNRHSLRFTLKDIDSLVFSLSQRYPEISWHPRLRFSGVIRSNKTGLPGIPFTGLGMDLTPEGPERKRLRLDLGLVAGGLPEEGGAGLGFRLAQQLGVVPGDTVVIVTTRADGELTELRLAVAGIIRFGVSALDRQLLVADIGEVQALLGAGHQATELLGFFRHGFYDDHRAVALARSFNLLPAGSEERSAPVMQALRDAAGFGSLIELISAATGLVVFIFVLAMAVVLLNAGLLNSLRRYQEIGIRLALGETKLHLYGSLLSEAFFIGSAGSLLGTLLGLGASWYLQTHGLDISGMMRNASVVMEDVLRARIAGRTFFIGFLPGLTATFAGSALAGLGIFRRSPARLTRELAE